MCFFSVFIGFQLKIELFESSSIIKDYTRVLCIEIEWSTVLRRFSSSICMAFYSSMGLLIAIGLAIVVNSMSLDAWSAHKPDCHFIKRKMIYIVTSYNTNQMNCHFFPHSFYWSRLAHSIDWVEMTHFSIRYFFGLIHSSNVVRKKSLFCSTYHINTNIDRPVLLLRAIKWFFFSVCLFANSITLYSCAMESKFKPIIRI